MSNFLLSSETAYHFPTLTSLTVQYLCETHLQTFGSLFRFINAFTKLCFIFGSNIFFSLLIRIIDSLILSSLSLFINVVSLKNVFCVHYLILFLKCFPNQEPLIIHIHIETLYKKPSLVFKSAHKITF